MYLLAFPCSLVSMNTMILLQQKIKMRLHAQPVNILVDSLLPEVLIRKEQARRRCPCRTTRSATLSSSVCSRLMITRVEPFRFAISGNPAAGQTTSDDPMARKRSHARVSSSARCIAVTGMAWPNDIVADLMWPPQPGQSGASSAGPKRSRTHDRS